MFALQVHLISSESGLTVRTKLHSLKIKDELQQQQSGSAQYLAYSVLKNEDIQESLGTCDSFDKEMPVGHADDEDAYTDALPEFLSPTEPGTPDMDMIQCSMMMDSDEHVGLEDTEGGFHEKDTSQGKSLCDEVFYEVQGGEFSDFVSVVFLTRSSSSHDYNGIDTQVCSERPSEDILLPHIFLISFTKLCLKSIPDEHSHVKTGVLLQQTNCCCSNWFWI